LEQPNAAAAAVKLPRSATAAKQSMRSIRVGIVSMK
jgi:hypothetical protein